MKSRNILLILVLMLMAGMLLQCKENPGDPADDDDDSTSSASSSSISLPAGRSLYLSMSFPTSERARGIYIWITDTNGSYIDTLQQYHGEEWPAGATNAFYLVNGYRYGNDNCTNWQAAVGEPVGATNMLVLDGVTAASIPYWGTGCGAGGTNVNSFIWDCLDNGGSPVPDGTYTVHFEVTFDVCSGGTVFLPWHNLTNNFYDSVNIYIGIDSTNADFMGSDISGRVANVTAYYNTN